MKTKIVVVFMFLFQLALGQIDNDYKILPAYKPPKSPNAAAFEKFTSVPINYQTGQVNYSIPMYTIETDGVIVPITLNYNNTGLKVTEVPSWVGLGWHLAVGGAITRTVKGIPDDGPRGLMDPYYAQLQLRVVKNQSSGLEKYHYFKDVVESIADSEHDMFHFDVPGIKGSFYINRFGECIQLPRSNNKIEYTRSTQNNTLDKFSITDVNGNKYLFNLKEESKISLYNNQTGGIPNYYNNIKGTTWYLSEIQTKSGGQVNFEYAHYQYTKTEKTETYQLYSVQQCQTSTASPVVTIITTLVDVYQLSRISWKNGYVDFDAGNARQDIKQMDATASVPSLRGISVYSPGTSVKYITFEYNETNRLLLKKIKNVNVARNFHHAYEFNYYDEEPYKSWPSYQLASTSYNAQDYWGYYNGQINNQFLLPFNTVPSHPVPLIPNNTAPIPAILIDEGLKARVNRAPNSNFAQYGMLKEIIYPTGGKSRFYYEGNTILASSALTPVSGSEYVVNTLPKSTNGQGQQLVTLGGLRIKKIEFYNDLNGSNPSTVTNLMYDQNASTHIMPVYVSAIKIASAPGMFDPCVLCANPLVYTLHSSSLVNDPAYLVEYYKVTEVQGSGQDGQTVHIYSPSQLNPHRYWFAPFGDPLCLNWTSGETNTLVQTYPNNKTISERSIKKWHNDYTNGNPLDSFGTDLKIAVIRNDACGPDFTSLSRVPSNNSEADVLINNVFNAETILLRTQHYVTTEIHEKSLQPTGGALEKTAIYHYSLNQRNRLLPNSMSTFQSNGLEAQTKTSYPQDYLAMPVTDPAADQIVKGLSNLIVKNLLDVPVEEIRTINKNGNEYVTGAKLIIYSADRAVVSEILELTVSDPIPIQNFTKSSINAQGGFVYDNRYIQTTAFTKFDDRDQLTEYDERSTGNHAILWDYNASYTIADVKNSRLSETAYTSFEADGSGNWTIVNAARVDDGITGNKCYDLAYGNITKTGLGGATYVVSYWTSNNQPFTITGTQGTIVRGKKIGNWTYFEHKVTGVSQVTIPQTTALVDELRLYPAGAQMTTYTYTPLIGMTSQCDVNNRISYYEYDDFNRLKLIRDQDGNIIKTIDYRYQTN
ncbi:hypothetical protein [Niastella populi]|uniref:Sugar-binding protein n=1 Tax=Niastella populi TaxID=550983 RepID=A0A1V9EJV4_9BACT|nr:hypothetical protein [Niastella populi]OQP46214.1 hypothetical protein A4R26_32110 [Niastella populi]